MKLNFIEYFKANLNLINKLIHFDNSTYWVNGELFPQIINKSYETFNVFIITFFISIVISTILTCIIFTFFQKNSSLIGEILDYIDAIPDLLIISLLQLFVITFFKKTGILLAKISGFGHESSVLLPIIILSVPSITYFTKVSLLSVKNEVIKNYILLAKSKGLSNTFIFSRHIFRNILYELFINSKTLIWSMLSTLVIIEYLFQNQGIFHFLLSYREPEVFVLVMLLIYLPFFVCYKIALLFIPNNYEKDVK
ncbi:ABC transporter permease subunit [Metabacillus sp. 22489]|uniref:ABC transporter permease subunit n=1 Tax=Metabacillus sp. 22489 TaxID=3453928 RepID=UPI003F84CBC0